MTLVGHRLVSGDAPAIPFPPALQPTLSTQDPPMEGGGGVGRGEGGPRLREREVGGAVGGGGAWRGGVVWEGGFLGRGSGR